MGESILTVGLISDTHSHLDNSILKHLSACDEIWHAGDIGNFDVIDRLKTLKKPLRLVYGNIDSGDIRSETTLFQEFYIGKSHVLMLHIGGSPGKYYTTANDLILKYKPDVFICGHSHICVVKYVDKLNMLHINPGACGLHGFHKIRTMLKLSFNAEKINSLSVIELGNRGALS